MEAFVKAIILFVLAGFADIGGVWLILQWVRGGRPWPMALLGALVLVSYGFIPTLQTSPFFGRIYAAYGGMFIVLSLAWGFLFDSFRPDWRDLLGAGVCLVGVMIIYFSPR
jgi:small multidrug resistance family-3 protein